MLVFKQLFTFLRCAVPLTIYSQIVGYGKSVSFTHCTKLTAIKSFVKLELKRKKKKNICFSIFENLLVENLIKLLLCLLLTLI
jgi:hypothetical protein